MPSSWKSAAGVRTRDRRRRSSIETADKWNAIDGSRVSLSLSLLLSIALIAARFVCLLFFFIILLLFLRRTVAVGFSSSNRSRHRFVVFLFSVFLFVVVVDPEGSVRWWIAPVCRLSIGREFHSNFYRQITSLIIRYEANNQNPDRIRFSQGQWLLLLLLLLPLLLPN